jgi:glucokinase
MSHSRQFIPLSAAQPPFFAAIDLGGTNIKAGVVDDLGRPLSWLSVPTNIQRGPEEGSHSMARAVLEAIAKAGLQPAEIARVGLGSPGTMDIASGLLLEPSNLPGWWNFPIRDRVSEHSGLPVTFANDARSAAFGEFWVGIGRDFHSMVLFTLGTGVGGGIIIGDFSIEGEHGAGAELGHVIIDYHDTARLCSCGGRGHLEGYASATALIQRTAEALADGRPSSLSARVASGAELTPVLVAEQAELGDSLANEIIRDTARYLGVGIVTAMHTIDPDLVVLAGAMTFGGHQTALGRHFLETVRQEVRERAFPLLAEDITIDYASLGGDAGFIGAAGIARLEYLRSQERG